MIAVAVVAGLFGINHALLGSTTLTGVAGLRAHAALATLSSEPFDLRLYPLPAESLPNNIVAGPDGNLWFVDGGLNVVGVMTPSGVLLKEYTLSGYGPFCIIVGPHGNDLWFTEQAAFGRSGGYVGEITTSGNLVEYYTAEGMPFGITVGPDDNVWVTLANGGRVLALSTAGAVLHDYPVGGFPTGITTGPDGDLWISETNAHKIGRLTTAGKLREFPVTGDPFGITPAGDRRLWFAEYDGHEVGAITTRGRLSEYNIPNSVPNWIVYGPGNKLWFSDLAGHVGRISFSGDWTEYSVPDGGPQGICLGPDRRWIWFTEQGGGEIGSFRP